MTDAKARLLQMIADEPHMGGGGLLKAIGKAQKVAKAAETGARAILPAAEREANLAKMLAPSVEKRRMLHGSSNPDITQFKTGKMLLNEKIPGNTVEPWAVNNRNAVFLTPEPSFSGKYSGDEWNQRGQEAPTTYPVYVQATNPWDFEKPEHRASLVKKLNELYPAVTDGKWLSNEELVKQFMLEKKIKGLAERDSNWSTIETPEVQAAIQALGHDSFYANEAGVKNIGIYDPAKIKSAIGNRGTYDLTDPDITKAHGGAVHMAGGGRTSKMPWERYDQPKKVAEMRARPINPLAGAVKSGADYATQLIDKGPSFANLMGDVVGAVPFVGPDLRKRMESSNISIPTDINLASNMPAEDYQHGQRMQYRKPGISTTSVPTKDVLEAINVSDLVGTPGLSKVAEDVGYGKMPDAFDLLDAASVAGLGYGAAKAGLKGGRKAAGALSDLAKSEAGYKLAQKAMEYAPAAQPMNIVKEPGGNWLSGTVENALEPLKRRVSTENIANYTPEQVRSLMESGSLPRNDALNKWIDSNLTNYVKKQMATPNDPVRKLAEEGITHMPQNEIDFANQFVPEALAVKRMNAGQPSMGVGKSNAAKGWEAISDENVYGAPAREYAEPLTKLEIQRGFTSAVKSDPWLTKVDPNTRVHYPENSRSFAADLGFNHIVDVLKEDLATGRIRPEQLNKISMEQAVRRTYEYDQELAAKMKAAKAAAREGLPVHKEYPEGFRWMELNKPGAFASESEAMGHSVRGYEPPKGHPDWTEGSGNSGSSGYGHGGWEAIKSGKAKVYSLVDKEGQPHVTVEVRANKPETWDDVTKEVGPEKAGEYWNEFNALLDTDPSFRNPYIARAKFEEFFKDKGLQGNQAITQIKGKQNRAPKEDYLPYVQDFVKSGQWSDVGDLKNTGLIESNGRYFTEPEFVDAAKKYGRMGVQDVPWEVARQRHIDAGVPEDEALLNWVEGLKEGRGRLDIPEEPRMAEGGEVKPFFEEKSAKQRIMEMIAKEPHMAGGGLLKAIKTAQKAAKVEHPLVFPRAAAKSIEDIRPIAQRMAEQVTGEFVKQNPKVTTNPAGKSRKQFERERSLPLETRNVVPEREAPAINYEDLMGHAIVGVPGDPTMGGVAKRGSLEEVARPTVELTRVGDITPDYPVPLFGGPRYGDDEKFWASGLSTAIPVQNSVDELAKLYEAPVLGKYIKMGEGSENFALHNLDALLSIQRPEKLNKAKMAQLTELIKAGSPEYGKFPGFTGFKDPADVLLQAQMDSKLRKHIAETLRKPTITDQLGLPNGLDVVAAITYPELRNLEIGASGFSVGKMSPKSDLRQFQSSHPTYDTDIPGSFLGRSKYPTPYEIAFPDTTAYARSTLKPGVNEFSMMKMLGPRERIDQQYIDEMKMYEQLMKQYTGKKKGGLAHSKKVKRHGNTVPH